MSTATGGTGGQAPTSGQQTGQAPQANNGGSPQSTAPQSGQASDGNTSPSSQAGQQSQGQSLSAADYERIIGDLRKENASHRTENAKIAADLKKFQDAQLTDQQRLERNLGETQAAKLEMELRLQQQSLQLAGYRLGASLGIGDVGAALALVMAEHGHEVKFAADGTPENVSDLLKAVLKDHPVLAASMQAPGGGQQNQRPPSNSGGAANPGTGTRAGGAITKASYAAMSQQERIARNKEVMEVLRQNGGRLPD